MGVSFLTETLGSLVADLMALPDGALELDATKMADAGERAAHVEALVQWCRVALDAIYGSLERMPPSFCCLCACLWDEVSAKFPEARFVAVAGFLFLRLLCPAIVTPEAHGLAVTVPSRGARRNLTLVAKTLQQLANGVEFGQKEEVRGGWGGGDARVCGEGGADVLDSTWRQ